MTPRAAQVLDWTREFSAVSGLRPTVAIIAKRLEISIAQARRDVDALVAGGMLQRHPAGGVAVPATPDLRPVPTDVLAAELARRGVTLASLDRNAPGVVGQQVSCAADCCATRVERGHLMCRQHWFALPLRLRQRILTSNGRRDSAAFERAVSEARDFIDTGKWRAQA